MFKVRYCFFCTAKSIVEMEKQMEKKRFMVVSGFLGAGKTTTMVALTE